MAIIRLMLRHSFVAKIYDCSELNNSMTAHDRRFGKVGDTQFFRMSSYCCGYAQTMKTIFRTIHLTSCNCRFASANKIEFHHMFKKK